MSHFTIRVYGILQNDRNEVLVSDELIKGAYYTKFPGGGLEWGEGTRDCLIREFKEEMNLAIEPTEHLYTTDFFQLSAFNPAYQVVSIYYKVKALEPIQVPMHTAPFWLSEITLTEQLQSGRPESFRFINWNDLSEEDVSLPIDKKVVQLIKSNG